LIYKAFDLFALGGTLDWSTELLKIYQKSWAQDEKQEKDFEAKRILGTKPSLPLSAYAGKYSDPLYGEVIITTDGETLTAVANNQLKATYNHWHFDTFRGWFDKKWYGKGNLIFSLGADGAVTKVNFFGFDFQRDISKSRN
jgi:hypothetical protein